MGEVEEIYRNLAGYFNVLLRWKQEDDAKKSSQGNNASDMHDSSVAKASEQVPLKILDKRS